MAKKQAKVTTRDEELSGRSEIAEKLEKVFASIEKGFADQLDRSDRQMDYWDAYNGNLSRYQNYTGGLSNIFVPIIKNGVRALVTRQVNQAFPQSGRHVEVVTGDEEIPYAMIALVEHYIRKSNMRTQAIPAALLNGYIEGQVNVYAHWDKIERYVVSRETKPLTEEGVEMPELGEVEEIVEERIDDAGPCLEVLHDADVLVLPATAATIDQALERGGSVTICRRWTKDEIKQRIDDGDVDEDEGELLIEQMGNTSSNNKDVAKKLAQDSGIHISGKSSFALVYETWTKLKVDGKRRVCRAFFSGEAKPLGCKLNPFWNDKVPLLSAPMVKTPGVFKGASPIDATLDMQYWANDMANEAAHTMYFTLAPIVAVDPERVSKWKELVSDVAAVWPVNPDGVKMLEWPNKAREALEIIQAAKAFIFETLGVNPSMLPQQTGVPGRKRNQAEVALEQQVDILQTSDATVNLEEQILTPTVQRFVDYDMQFREEEELVRKFGPLGMQAGLERVPPNQMGNRYWYSWSGVEAARNAANIQQQIGFLGTIMKMPPQSYMGYRLDAAPLIEHAIGSIFSAGLARQVFKSMSDEMSVDPKVENSMLDQGFEVMTHAADQDPQHLQVHMAGLKAAMGGANQQAVQQYKAHIQRHQQAMAMKQQAMASQGQPGKQPQPGAPRPGAMPAPGPKRPQQPAGAIHPDQMARAGAPQQPRKT